MEAWFKTNEQKPEKIMVTEPHGQFLVNDYPINWCGIMVDVVKDFIAEQGEKPSPQPPENQSSDHKKKGQRIRKPVPAYTTRKK